MNALEEQLRDLPRQTPSDRLDARVESMLDDAANRPPVWYCRPVPIWGAAVGCVIGLLVGGLARPQPERASVLSPVVAYVVPADPELRRALGIENAETVSTLFNQPRTIVEFSGVSLSQPEL